MSKHDDEMRHDEFRGFAGFIGCMAVLAALAVCAIAPGEVRAFLLGILP